MTLQGLTNSDKTHSMKYYDLANIQRVSDEDLCRAFDKVLGDGSNISSRLEGCMDKPQAVALAHTLAKKQYVAEQIEAEANRRGLKL